MLIDDQGSTNENDQLVPNDWLKKETTNLGNNI